MSQSGALKKAGAASSVEGAEGGDDCGGKCPLLERAESTFLSGDSYNS